jgi:hypothetical protein
LLSLAVLIVAILAGGSVQAQTIPLAMDEAKLVKLPERASSLVIGNPLIADVSLQSGGMMVITGKGHGATNLIALDRAGTVLLERLVEVTAPRHHTVVMYRGIERHTYSCAPTCERMIAVGDNNQHFEQALTQTMTRAGGAVGIAQGSAKN